MDYFKAILIFLLSTTCFAGVEIDPNDYVMTYDTSGIDNMTYLELLYVASDTLADANDVINNARLSVGLSPGEYADPNSHDLTMSQIVGFEFVCYYDKVKKKLLDYDIEAGRVDSSDYELLILDIDNETVNLFCDIFGMRYTKDD